MISVSGKNWEEIKINQNLVNKLKQDYGFNDILSRLIISRKFNEEEIASINNNLNLVVKKLKKIFLKKGFLVLNKFSIHGTSSAHYSSNLFNSYNIKINSSVAKYVEKNYFDLVFNIDAGERIFFDKFLLFELLVITLSLSFFISFII